MSLKKIGVFTGNRAEFGLLYSVIEKLNTSSEVDLQLFVSGAHLDKSFGSTIDFIEQAGFKITDKIKIEMSHDDLYSTAVAVGSGVVECARVFREYSPDLLIVYGDRFESFSAAIAASQMGIPVGHIEGGDVTEGGALDDSVRHAITKLSHLHFTTNDDARLNVLQLGEESSRVFNVGLPSLDGIYAGSYLDEVELLKNWSLDPGKPIILFTQHSIATQYNEVEVQIARSLEALKVFIRKGVQVVITYPNNDAGGKVIVEKIKKFQEEHRDGVVVVPSLGARNYHGFLALARSSKNRIACVGNSSSGIKETAVFGCPTVNIGSRQAGRLRADNVIDTGYCVSEIEQAISTCLFDEDFRDKCRRAENPYGNGTSAINILKVILNTNLDKRLLTKKTIFVKSRK